MNQFSKSISERNLALLFPLIAKEWHLTRNGDLYPNQVLIGCNKKVWWQCSKISSHEWEAIIADRVRRKTKCPYCAHKKASKESNFALEFSNIAAQWHPTKNGSVKPSDVLSRSMFRAWWLCSRGHEWESNVATRTDIRHDGIGPQCPFCSGRKVTPETSLATLFPMIAAQWHPTRNGNITPDKITAFSSDFAWWQCENGHEWKTIIGSRTSKGPTGCIYCLGRKATPEHNLMVLYPNIGKEWHPTKNGNLTPKDSTPHSKQYFWWLCPKDHAYSMQVDSRTTQKQSCPYCANMRVCADNCLAYLFPEIAKEWHPTKNGDLKSSEIVAYSNTKVWWLCPKDILHEWQAKVDSRTLQGSGCPFCSHHSICLTNNLAYSYPDLALEWDTERNELTAEEVVAGGKTRFWWKCKDNPKHHWLTTIYDRIYKKYGCPSCSKSHSGLEKFVEAQLGLERYNCKVLTNFGWKPDFQLSDKIYLNVDGLYWHAQRPNKYHLELRKAFESEEKRILQFYEDEIHQKWPIVENIINYSLGKITNKISARKCTIIPITRQQALEFGEENHLMGAGPMSHCLGLQYDGKIISFFSYHIQQKNELVIDRFCNKIGFLVRGSFQKFLAEIRRKYTNCSIISFCDLRYTTGKSYEQAGFKLVGIHQRWCWTDGISRFNRRACMAGNGKTEAQNAQELGWYKLYDAGQAKYVLTNSY